MVLFDSLRPKTNRATELGNSAVELCTALVMSECLISLGGFADGRLSETFDATLDERRRRQGKRHRQSQSSVELAAFVLMLCLLGFLE